MIQRYRIWTLVCGALLMASVYQRTQAAERRVLTPAEQEEYIRRSLAEQAPQRQAAEERARKEYIARQIQRYHDSGNLSFLLECVQTFSADEAAREMAPLLRHTNADVRAVAINSLARHGAAIQSALPHLIERLRDSDSRVLMGSLQIIGSIGPSAAPAVPDLARILAAETEASELAATSLGSIGPAASSALPALDRAAKSPRAVLSRNALMAAGRVRREEPLSCAELRAGVVVFSGEKAYRAFQGARVPVCPPAETATLIVQYLATSPPPSGRMEACDIVGALGVCSREVVLALLKASADADPSVAAAAARAMDLLPATNNIIVPLLTEAALGNDDRLAVNSAKMLARFERHAASAALPLAENLVRATGAAHYERTIATLRAVQFIGSGEPMLRSNLVALLAETSVVYNGLRPQQAKAVRAAILFALSENGAPGQAIPAIIDELANATSPVLIVAAARAAGSSTNQHEQLVPFLQTLLTRPQHRLGVNLDRLEDHVFVPTTNATSVFLESIRALAHFGPAARPALPILRERARDPAVEAWRFPAYQREAALLVEVLAKTP